MMKDVAPAVILGRSGLYLKSHPAIPRLKHHHCRVVDKAIAGDAPKDFLRIYEYGTGRKTKPKTWPSYIAKVGQKWYPNESITEHLLTRIGQGLHLDLADSKLMLVKGQLRFLSRYFLRKDESLVHGAEIFAGYLQDKPFVEEVEAKNQSRNVFTFQFVEDAFLNRFPDEVDELLAAFVRLLAFDALVGNNDRHFYNWGVITDIRGRRKPRFAPIYDTARALFWNETDAKLEGIRLTNDSQRRAGFLKKYVERSNPKTGWDGVTSPNHFDLISKIAERSPGYREILQGIASQEVVGKVELILGDEFLGLMSGRRCHFVLECLRERQERFRRSLDF